MFSILTISHSSIESFGKALYAPPSPMTSHSFIHPFLYLQTLKKLSVSSDLQQSGIEGDDGVHHDVANKDNVDGQVPSNEKKVCWFHMFSILTISHFPLSHLHKCNMPLSSPMASHKSIHALLYIVGFEKFVC